MKKHAKSTRAAARVYQEKLRAQELQAHKARTKGKALYTDDDLKAVMLDILDDPQHSVLAAVRSFNSPYKEHDPRRIPPGTANDWWKKVKPVAEEEEKRDREFERAHGSRHRRCVCEKVAGVGRAS